MREDRPSSTATLIAAATVFLARDARVPDLVPPGAAEWCARCLEALSGLKTVEMLSHPGLRWAARLAERATVPGLLLHFMLRKRWIEEGVRAALAEGCGQVVVVGAGFDTLALRLSREFPGATFIEIDHPATQRYKRLAGEGAGAAANLHFIAADLSLVRLQDALSGGAYRPEARSVFIIEGLLMYLTVAEVGGVFTALRELQRAGGRVVFTVMEPRPMAARRSTTRRRSSRGFCRVGASPSSRRCRAMTRHGFSSGSGSGRALLPPPRPCARPISRRLAGET